MNKIGISRNILRFKYKKANKKSVFDSGLKASLNEPKSFQ